MERLLFVMDGCHKCQHSINHLINQQIKFRVINILDFEEVIKYKKYLRDQSLPIFLKDDSVLTYAEILEL